MTNSRPQIHIHGLEVHGCVGVMNEERSARQRLVLNITVSLAHDLARVSDEIGRTANYSAIAAEAERIVMERSDKLIETLADEIAGRLVLTFPVREAIVEVRKFVLSNADYVSATATRTGAP